MHMTKGERDLINSRTLSGHTSIAYNNQRASSRQRKHPMPTYTKFQLIDWVMSQDNSKKLFEDWISSDYDSNLAPSVDRLNDDKGYSFDNIRLVTWIENKSVEWSKKLKPISLKHKLTKIEYKFNSIKEACDTLNLSVEGISNVLGNRAKTSGGFYAKYTTI